MDKKSRGASSQHRPQREVAKAKELRDANKKVQQLKREVKRLRKALEKEFSREPLEDVPEPEATPAAPDADLKKCGCGSTELTELKTPGGSVIIYCRCCKERLPA